MKDELVKQLMQDEGPERKQFEAAFGPFYMDRCHAPGDDPAQYEYAPMNFAWRGWNVRRAMAADRIAALEAALRELLHQLDTDDVGGLVEGAMAAAARALEGKPHD